MDARIVELWTQYRDALLELYPEGDFEREFVGPAVEAAALDRFDQRSEELTGALLGALRELEPADTAQEGGAESWEAAAKDAYELEAATLATAALDAVVGGDVLVALREEAEALSDGIRIPAAIEVGAQLGGEMSTIERLVEHASATFPDDEVGVLRGSTIDPSPTELRARRAIDELVEATVPTSRAFGIGLLSAEVGILLEAVGLLGALDQIPVPTRRLGLGKGLMAKAVTKLLGLIKVDAAAELTVHFGLERLSESLDVAVDKLSDTIVTKVVRADRAERRVVEALAGKNFDEDNMPTLYSNLDSLQRNFQGNMDSAKTIAVWFRRAALAAANGAGLAYSFFTCADRLDTVPGWVPGIPTIVTQA